MPKHSPEFIVMHRATVAERRKNPTYANSPIEAQDTALLAEFDAQEAAPFPAVESAGVRGAVEVGNARLRGETTHAVMLDDDANFKPDGDSAALDGAPHVVPASKGKTYGEIAAAKLSSTSMPRPTDANALPDITGLPKKFTLPGKFQAEYERARKISGVEKIGKAMFATPTADPKRKELEAERKRAQDMVSLVQQILDQRAQLAVALANVSSTINLKNRSEEDLQHMGRMAASMSKTIVENLTDYDLQSYTLIAGLNNLSDDGALRRAGSGTRDRVLDLARVAASMLADARNRIEQMRTAGRAALSQRDEALKRVAELTGEEFKPQPVPPATLN